MSVDVVGFIASAVCLGAIGYYLYERLRGGGSQASVARAREIPPRRLTTADVLESFKPTGKSGELLFARSEDGSRQVTARWTEYAAEGLVQILVAFMHNKHSLRLTEEIRDQLTERVPWMHKAENLEQVCATGMVREVQRGGPYTLRLLRDEWIAERKTPDVKPGEALETAQIRFYLDGRRATYLRSASLK